MADTKDFGPGPVSRRRGNALEAAILEAAWQELTAVGYAKATMSNIAARAGTSKAVLYRRWSAKAELVLDVAVDTLAAIPCPDTGVLRQDLIVLCGSVATMFTRVPRDTFSGLLAETANDPQLHERAADTVKHSIVLDNLRIILERADSRGEITLRPLSHRILSFPFDLLRYQYMSGTVITEDVLAELVDDLVIPVVNRPAG